MTDSIAIGELVNCDQLGEILRKAGFPIAQSTLREYCKPYCGKGPKPVARWGGRVLFDPQQGLEWARSRARQVHNNPSAI